MLNFFELLPCKKLQNIDWSLRIGFDKSTNHISLSEQQKEVIFFLFL